MVRVLVVDSLSSIQYIFFLNHKNLFGGEWAKTLLFHCSYIGGGCGYSDRFLVMFSFIQTILFWINYLSCVHLCKQLYHMKIMFPWPWKYTDLSM